MSSRRALIADDSLLNRRVLVALLSGEGYACVTAADGAAALAALQREHFDVAVLDLDMPELDGVEVTRRFRATEPNHGSPKTRIVVVTGDDSPKQAARCLASGADGFLGKPIDADALLSVVEDAPVALAGNAHRALVEICETFFADADTARATLLDAVDTRSSAELAMAAKSLREDFQAIGALHAAAAAQAVEDAAHADDVDKALDGVPALLREAREVEHALRRSLLRE